MAKKRGYGKWLQPAAQRRFWRVLGARLVDRTQGRAARIGRQGERAAKSPMTCVRSKRLGAWGHAQWNERRVALRLFGTTRKFGMDLAAGSGPSGLRIPAVPPSTDNFFD
jgi:hypothetical protein